MSARHCSAAWLGCLSCLHGSPPGIGVLGAPGCRGPWWDQAALLQSLARHLPPCASICRSHCFLQGPRIVSLQGGPTGVAGWPGASWSTAGELYTFLKCFVPLPSVPLQYLSNLSATATLASVRGLGTQLCSVVSCGSLQTSELGQLCNKALYLVSGVCKISPHTSPGCHQHPGWTMDSWPELLGPGYAESRSPCAVIR